MLGKLLIVAAVVLLALLGWKRIEGMARKASRRLREERDRSEPIDLDRDPDSGAWRKRNRD